MKISLKWRFSAKNFICKQQRSKNVGKCCCTTSSSADDHATKDAFELTSCAASVWWTCDVPYCMVRLPGALERFIPDVVLKCLFVIFFLFLQVSLSAKTWRERCWTTSYRTLCTRRNSSASVMTSNASSLAAASVQCRSCAVSSQMSTSNETWCAICRDR